MVTRIFIFIGLYVWSFSTFSGVTSESVVAALSKQKQVLPTQVRGALYLTDIVIDDNNIQRFYQHNSLNFGAMSAQQSQQFSQSITAELLEQCFAHQGLIFQENLRFEYHFRDMNKHLVALITIDKQQCHDFLSHKLR